jgi:hypothetical protein
MYFPQAELKGVNDDAKAFFRLEACPQAPKAGGVRK